MRQYHDVEWGMPTANDHLIFEKISLEGFQSGLSWATILNKRPDFRRVFLEFDPVAVARFGENDVERLRGDSSIVRHAGKITSTVNNARRCLELIAAEGSLAAYLWRFEPRHAPALGATTCPEAEELARDLKRRGWTFVGPTTMYAMMQSLGMVNDHDARCRSYLVVDDARRSFIRPT